MQNNSNVVRQLIRVLLVLQTSTLGGCGILLGNVRPAEEKAKNYSVADLSRGNSNEWTRLEDPMGADEAYQSKKTSAVIAVNSSWLTPGTMLVRL